MEWHNIIGQIIIHVSMPTANTYQYCNWYRGVLAHCEGQPHLWKVSVYEKQFVGMMKWSDRMFNMYMCFKRDKEALSNFINDVLCTVRIFFSSIIFSHSLDCPTFLVFSSASFVGFLLLCLPFLWLLFVFLFLQIPFSLSFHLLSLLLCLILFCFYFLKLCDQRFV